MSLDLFCEGLVGALPAAARSHLMHRTLPPNSTASGAAREIIRRVRSDGDQALFAMAEEFDDATLDTLEVPRSEWEAAANDLPPDVRSALQRAADNISRFHAAQVPAPVRFETEPGVVLERRVGPVQRAGVYAPGGRAAYPSSVLMGAVPARAAGVNEVIVCSPPGPNGKVAAATMSACWLAGADRLFSIGGAGAVAAMAFGTDTIPAVDVLVGPGNAFVNEAKRQVAGTVRIDSPAGPSELLVLADGSAPPDWVAAEMVAQAEHDTEACVGAVCVGEGVSADVRRALQIALARAPRAGIAREALAENGFLLEAVDRREAVRFANEYAAEHLALMLSDAANVVDRVRSAGTVFVGSASSVAFGDYMSGANHVLPTAGAARAFSGLSAEHFLRSFTVQTISHQGARSLSEPTAVFADAEGLPGHAEAARLRGAVPPAPPERGGA